MNALDRQLLARIGALPVGAKLPLSAMAREADATVSVVMSAIDALVVAGQLDRVTLRPPVTTDAAPTGETLFERIKAEAARRGLTVTAASIQIWSSNSSVHMLRKSPRPRAGTIEKVERWIASPPPNSGDDRAEALPASATPAPVEAGAGQVGGGDARSDDAAPADRQTGAELVARLRQAHRAVGGSQYQFFAPLAGGTNKVKQFLDQLEVARRPKPLTIRRVEAFLAGDAIPPNKGAHCSGAELLPRCVREERGMPPSQRMQSERRSLDATMQRKAAVDEARQQAASAHDDRRPGETLADRIRRCGREIEGESETAETTTGLPRNRDFPAIPADRWSKLAALASELGKRRGEVLIDVIDAGILCVTEDLREGER